LGGHCRRALKLLEECNETFRHGLFQGRILDLEESSDCQQPRSSGQDVRTSGWVSHWPFPSRITRAARPKPTTDWLMLAILNCQSEDVKSSRRSKREGGKDEPHLLSSRSAPITRDHMSGSWNCHRFWCSARFCRVVQACTRFWMAQLVFKSKENPAIHNGTWCNDPHTVDWLAFKGFIVHWLAFKRFVFHFSIIPRRRSPLGPSLPCRPRPRLAPPPVTFTCF
jgi:hypothetical protein